MNSAGKSETAPQAQRKLAGDFSHRIASKKGMRPGRDAGNRRHNSGTPAGVHSCWTSIRGCRSFLALPPANFRGASGTDEPHTPHLLSQRLRVCAESPLSAVAVPYVNAEARSKSERGAEGFFFSLRGTLIPPLRLCVQMRLSAHTPSDRTTTHV